MGNSRQSDKTSTWDPPPHKELIVVGDLIDSVLGKISRGSPGAILTLRSVWRDIAGPLLADRCDPVSLDDGVLMVEVIDGATASLLRFETTNLARRASDLLVAPVRSVSLRVRRRL